MRSTIRTTALVAALAALPALATAQQQPDPEAMARGGQLYGQTCARCHNPRPATERSDREWTTVVLHMRARANLTKADAEAILVFLQATNRDGGQTAARNDSRRDARAEAGRAVTAWRLAGVGLPAYPPPELDPATSRALGDYLERLHSGQIEP